MNHKKQFQSKKGLENNLISIDSYIIVKVYYNDILYYFSFFNFERNLFETKI